jgi:trimethylamine--corrinoid protein Co-methyltransferase
VSMFVEPVSPLLLGREDTQTIIEWAKAKLPLVCVSCPASGATAPVTLAGTIIQGAAESLVGNVIAQLINPGTPFIFGLLGFSMDMRTGLLATGGIETMLMCAASGQLARYYGLPCIGFAGGSSSNTLDTQAITEATMSMTLAALSGINLVQGIGYLESGLTGSYEMLTICDEIALMLRRGLAGVRVNEGTLGVDAIKKVGLGQSYLGLEHTRDYFSSEHLIPQLMSRLPFKEWHEKGEKKLEDRARERVKTILRDHHVPPIDEDIRKEMKNVVLAAENRHTGES